MDRAKRDAYFASLKVPLLVIYVRDGGVCWLCGGLVEWGDASRDHVRPRKFGGKTTPKNIRLAHRDCNSWRGHQSPARISKMLAAKRAALR